MRAPSFVLLSAGWFALIGPLVGGLPAGITVLLAPLSYAVGVLPALLAGGACALTLPKRVMGGLAPVDGP